MTDFKDPYTDPEKHAYDDNGIHPTTSVQHGTQRRVSITDAVFGEISEDGPNYRAVRYAPNCFGSVFNIGRLVGKVQPYLC